MDKIMNNILRACEFESSMWLIARLAMDYKFTKEEVHSTNRGLPVIHLISCIRDLGEMTDTCGFYRDNINRLSRVFHECFFLPVTEDKRFCIIPSPSKIHGNDWLEGVFLHGFMRFWEIDYTQKESIFHSMYSYGFDLVDAGENEYLIKVKK